jgi:hypothetical protein
MLLSGDGIAFFRYNGRAEASAKDPDKAAATFVECRTAADPFSSYNEVISARIDTGPAQAVFKGSSTWSWDDENNIGGTCKYVFHRVDSADPGVGACP